VHRILFFDGWRKHEGKAALGIPRRMWDVNVTVRLREME
jgi:hypothetical protein